ncbi:MAG: glutathione S-transferase family protein [Myxococcales bacterium]|nr:glutathione S-transferase family protein [Myxococcales bacterium]
MSHEDVILHGFAPSTYVRSARLACVDKDVAYRLAPLDFKGASHLALHPFGKMPILEHGAVRLFETAAILDYVDATFDGPSRTPTGTVPRARMRQWMSAAADVVYPDVVSALLVEGGPDEVAVARARERLAVLDGVLGEGRYLAGDALSLADLYVLPMVSFAAAQPAGDAILDGLGRLAEWRASLEDRPGFSATLAS